MNQSLAATGATGPALAEAFHAFTAAAGQLEFSYQQLHGEVIRLRQELEERNAALTSSLAENEKMRLALGRILETLPCGVVVVEPDHQVSFVNPETRRLLGNAADNVTLNEAAQMVLARLQHPEYAEQELCLNLSGKKRWLAVRSAPLYGPSVVIEPKPGAAEESGEDARSGQVLIIRDVTSQRDLEREREEARGLIALAEMSSVLAHEIRNPLGSMELLAGLLANSGNLSPEQEGFVEHLRAGVRSLSATLNNVLRVHTMGTAALSPLQLAPVLRDGIKFVEPLAEQVGVAFSLHEDLDDAEINGNAGELQQVLTNLALNAIRHMPEGGRVVVTATRQTKATCQVAAVEFTDTGCGIPAEYLENIFEAGFSTGQSAGLGLTVCRKIVQQHGGRIAVESQVGKGATFRMEFPIL
jgi:two-component system sensor histidine kinase FlrB